MRTKWARVWNGEITDGPSALPYQWPDPIGGDVIALRTLTEAALAAFGWRPVHVEKDVEEIDERIMSWTVHPAIVAEGRPVERWSHAFLPDAVERMARVVDEEAESHRMAYITPGEGQSQTYAEKRDEAMAFRAEYPDGLGFDWGNPQGDIQHAVVASVRGHYPLLVGEVGITADGPAAVADVILTKWAQWRDIMVGIERWRLGTKKRLREAASVTDALHLFNARGASQDGAAA